jgi:hypothetical protein
MQVNAAARGSAIPGSEARTFLQNKVSRAGLDSRPLAIAIRSEAHRKPLPVASQGRVAVRKLEMNAPRQIVRRTLRGGALGPLTVRVILPHRCRHVTPSGLKLLGFFDESSGDSESSRLRTKWESS